MDPNHKYRGEDMMARPGQPPAMPESVKEKRHRSVDVMQASSDWRKQLDHVDLTPPSFPASGRVSIS